MGTRVCPLIQSKRIVILNEVKDLLFLLSFPQGICFRNPQPIRKNCHPERSAAKPKARPERSAAKPKARPERSAAKPKARPERSRMGTRVYPLIQSKRIVILNEVKDLLFLLSFPQGICFRNPQPIRKNCHPERSAAKPKARPERSRMGTRVCPLIQSKRIVILNEVKDLLFLLSFPQGICFRNPQPIRKNCHPERSVAKPKARPERSRMGTRVCPLIQSKRIVILSGAQRSRKPALSAAEWGPASALSSNQKELSS